MRVVWMWALLLGVLVGACGPETESIDLSTPDGWTAEGDRWWRPEADTVRAFRSLDTLAEMGLRDDDRPFALGASASAQQAIGRSQFERAVKQSLVRLYRNQPQVVDSLFDRFVQPKLADVRLSGDAQALVDRYKKEAYRTLARHFREPRTLKSMGPGQDIPVPYPDSLRAAQVEGAVRMQVYLNAEGEPVAVELLESVHPVLDAIAMRATTEMRWQPAYVLQRGQARPIPSWSRFNVRFRVPPA